ncbi:arginine N-succinyltransferase [Hirschia litorea]|uniref:Arginine N-succinyltransferase n=1 Tax=Hirschia litorea TaxID=1199156 RepID=A0ABW2IHX3_9PROT
MNSGIGAYVIRPIEPSDLDGFYGLAEISGPGFTSLQTDRDYLEKYIFESVSSFAEPKSDQPQKFLLVMEEVKTGAIVGCAAVKTKIGQTRLFIDLAMKNARGQIVHDPNDAVYLDPYCAFDGATEVGSLFMHPDHRMGGLGRFLAKSRYLLISIAPDIFSSPIIAELRGCQNDEGVSDFYDSIHKQRLGKTFLEADAFITHADNTGIESTIPSGPILIDNLPKQARGAISKPHRSGVGAYHLLLREGFTHTGMVDLFDVGPIMSASVENIKTIQETITRKLCVKGTPQNVDLAIVSTTSLSGFRAIIDKVELSETGVNVSVETMQALGRPEGAMVQFWAGSDKQNKVQSTLQRSDGQSLKAVTQ